MKAPALYNDPHPTRPVTRFQSPAQGSLRIWARTSVPRTWFYFYEAGDEGETGDLWGKNYYWWEPL